MTEIPRTEHDGPVDGPGPNTPAARFPRRGTRRVVAGVAGGIADRFEVNEYLVRAVFIALTFLWGLGVAAYLVLWALLPSAPLDDADPRARERAPRSTSRRLGVVVTIALVVLVIVALSVSSPLHAVAPSVAAVWVVFLVVLSVVALRTPARRLTLRRIAALAVLVLASVIIVVVGGVVGFVASTGVALSGGNGNHVWQPTSLTDVRHVYRVEFGVGTLDLSTVRFPTTGYRIAVSVAVGNVRIVVPEDAVVDMTTSVGAGSAVALGGVVDGVATSPYSALPPGASTSTLARAPRVSVDARVGIGRIFLMRAR